MIFPFPLTIIQFIRKVFTSWLHDITTTERKAKFCMLYNCWLVEINIITLHWRQPPGLRPPSVHSRDPLTEDGREDRR